MRDSLLCGRDKHYNRNGQNKLHYEMAIGYQFKMAKKLLKKYKFKMSMCQKSLRVKEFASPITQYSKCKLILHSYLKGLLCNTRRRGLALIVLCVLVAVVLAPSCLIGSDATCKDNEETYI